MGVRCIIQESIGGILLSEISVFHDSHNIDFRNPFGAVEVGKVVKLRLEVNQRCVSYITIINLFNSHIELKINET